MGLTAYAKVREWLVHNFHPEAVRLPQNARPGPPAEVCIRVDLTQKLRRTPRSLTGDELAAWLWSFFESLGASHIVAMMDKTSYVPPEKGATQTDRDENRPLSRFSASSEFGPLGVRHQSGGSWERFSVAEAIGCREARGPLTHWLYKWARNQHGHRPWPVMVVLEYEFPLGKGRAVQIGPGSEMGDVSYLLTTPPIGEADVAQLPWIHRFPGMQVVDLQIDSDILGIALLWLCQQPPEKRDVQWMWVASTSDWRQEPIRAIETTFDVFTLIEPVAKEAPTFCVDLVALFHGLRGAFPHIPDPDDRVRCFVLACILQGTDFYNSKSAISPLVTFEVVLESVERGFTDYWKPLWRWWESTGSWSYERMVARDSEVERGKSQQQKELDLRMIGEPPEAFHVLIKWQAQLSKRPAREGQLIPDELPSNRSMPDADDIVQAHRELYFNIRYWEDGGVA